MMNISVCSVKEHDSDYLLQKHLKVFGLYLCTRIIGLKQRFNLANGIAKNITYYVLFDEET